MATGQLTSVLRCIHRLAGASDEADRTDRELLEQFAARHDEAAFADVVRRHGPMVLGVCRRVLRHEQDAEDVFQATFLVLARKAGSVAWRDGVGNWLYEVAYRLAMELKGRSARRRARERQVGMMRTSETPTDGDHNELAIALDEELHQLPERFRACLLLCVFEGKTRDEAAQELGCSLRTVKHRLERGRSLLRQRLARRGLTLAAVLLAHDAGRAVLSAALVRSTSRAALLFAAGSVSSRAAALAEGALSGMFAVKLKITTMVILTMTLLAAGAGLAVFQAPAANPAGSARGSSPNPLEKPRTERQERVDAYGDPLPDGALARLGTVRLRHGGRINALSLSADGKLLASGGSDNAVRLWQLPDGKEIRRFGGLRPILLGSAVALTPDGKTLAAGDNGQIFLWETATGKEKRRLTFFAHSLAFSPDGKVLAAGGREGPICLWDAATGKELHRLRGHPGQVNSLAFSSDGKRLVSGGLGKNVLLWDASTGKEIRSFRVDPERVNSVALSHDGKMVAAGSQDRFLYLWDAATGKALSHIQAVKEQQWVLSIAFSPDGKTLAILDSDGPIHLWDLATGKEKKQFVGHALGFGTVLFSADGKFLISGCYDKTIRVWNVATGAEVRTFGGHHGGIEAVAFSADGKRLATCGEDRIIRLWDAMTHQEIRRWEVQPDWIVESLAFSPDGKVLASGGSTIRLWDTSTGKEIRRLTGHRNSVVSLAFAPDGKTLASGTGGGEIKAWNPATGEVRFAVDQNANHSAFSLAFSPNGKILASAGGNLGNPSVGIIQLWDVASGKELPALQGREGFVSSLTFSPDGKVLAAANEAHWIGLWDVTTGQSLRRWQAVTGFAGTYSFRIAFSPDGKALVSGTAIQLRDGLWSVGHAVRVWEVATGKKRLEFRGHRGPIKALAVAPDGRSIATGSEDTSVLIWDLTGRTSMPPQAGALSEKELADLWTDLESDDAAKAFRAMSRLRTAPAQAVRIIKERVKPIRRPDGKRIAGLLRDLESEQFVVREKATRGLEEIGDAAEPALREAVANKPTAELRKRIALLLEKMDAARGRLRALRCIEVLEHLNTPAAPEVLRSLAAGAPDAWLTRQAKESLGRLGDER